MIDTSKYKRFFAFGCSFTSYYWPTWANIISLEIPETYNYARSGAGNVFIYQSIVEAINRHNINEDDLVMVMFSNVTREDRYVESRGWITPGNLYHQCEYDEKFLEKYFCPKGYLMRDLSLIYGAKQILKTTGARYELMTMVPIDSLASDNNRMDPSLDVVLELYKDTISSIKPSVFETIFNLDWNSRNKRPVFSAHWSDKPVTDNHPTPEEHLEYLIKIFPDIMLSDSTKNIVDTWNNRLFTCNTLKEIQNTFTDINKIIARRL